MNQQDENQNQLLLPRTAVVGDNAFDGDLLNRKELAVKLTGYLDRLREGAVLAIDAPWGEGKTWFGRNWERHLKDEGHKVVFIDAFEQDYMEDPFLLLVAEITEVLDDGKGSTKGLLEKAGDVGKAILPMSTKAMINMTGRYLLGSTDFANGVEDVLKAANGEIADATDEWIKDTIKMHVKEKQSLQHFKDELKKFAGAQDNKPVVIIIDELDRCNPTFAVQLIERVKHLFDVPNLVFVLLLNRNQLENAVKGVYGADTEASAYLGKFVNFFFMLPKRTSVDMTNNNHVKKYVSDVFKRYNFENEGRQDFEDCLSAMATIFNMSLRQIEQAIALYAFAQSSNRFHNYFAYIITLKVMKPKLFQRLIKGDDNAHEIAKTDIDNLNKELSNTLMAKHVLTPLSEWHAAHINGFKEGEMGDTCKDILDKFCRLGKSPADFIPYLASQIDLSIEQ